MKAVILAGSPETAMFPLQYYYPTLALPLAGEPLIRHILIYLKESGFSEVAVVSSGYLDWQKSLRDYCEKYRARGMAVSFHEEEFQSGTAGCLKELKGFVGSSHFLVINCNVFIERKLDISRFTAAHLASGAVATVMVEHNDEKVENLENIELDKGGVVKGFHILHRSRCNRHPLRTSGLYVFDPAVFDHINGAGYMDIKEQLIPELRSKGLLVDAYEEKGSVITIDSITDYFQLNKEVLFNDLEKRGAEDYNKTEVSDRIWVGKNVNIADTVYLLGPVIIGDGCTIEEGAHVIGPVSIGAGTCIGKNVLVRDSIIWQNAKISDESRVEYCIVGEGCVVPDGRKIRNVVMIEHKKYSENVNFVSLIGGNDMSIVADESSPYTVLVGKVLGHKIFLATKRLFDIVAAAAGLLFFLPLIIVIVLAVKLGSAGPAFFSQNRCGKDGKEFKMYKFRTMVEDAERVHTELTEQNEVDGPMFKIEKDPRVTRVGRFLRKTSLDELPQLFNVLKGEMSLVGPRPLVMEEMKFCPIWRDIRLKVKPGITGLWQVSGRSDVSFYAWIEYDTSYVKNQSLMMDLNVLVKTFMAVILGIGAK